MTWRTIPNFPLYEMDEEGVVRHRGSQRVRKPQFNGQSYLSLANEDGKHYSRTIRALKRLTWPDLEEPRRQMQSRLLVHSSEKRDERFYKIERFPDYGINRQGEVMNMVTKNIINPGRRGEMSVHLKLDGRWHYISVRRLMKWTFPDSFR